MSETITIAIPVYERYDFFEEALFSALKQTVPCQILVVDNASSHMRFADSVKALKDDRVRYYRNSENLGMTGNWNKCIELCDTEWITILHDDDWLHPQFIEFFHYRLKRDTFDVMAGEVHIGEVVKEEYAQSLSYDAEYKCVLWKNILVKTLSPFPGVIARTALLKSLQGFKQEYFPIADYELWCRLVDMATVVRYPVELAFYRLSGIQGSVSLAGKMIDLQDRLYAEQLTKHKAWLNILLVLATKLGTRNLYNHYKKIYKQDITCIHFSIKCWDIFFNILDNIPVLRSIVYRYRTALTK